MKVAIDGPAGSGKSTVAHALAAREGLTLLDTGAMYRCVTLACLQSQTALDDLSAVAEVARRVRIEFGTDGQGNQTVALDGHDVSADIRTPEVDAAVSAVAAVPAVREAMVAQQRAIGEDTDVVAEGRDIGTVVFPDAEVKVFLTADPAARAHRRAGQREGADAATDPGATADAEAEKAILDDLLRRDEADSTRAVAPLKPADDAVHIDSSALTVDEVVSRVVDLMNKSRAQAAQPQDGNPVPAAQAVPQDGGKAEEPDKPRRKAARSADKPEEMPFAKGDLDSYYDHGVDEYPLPTRALRNVVIGACGALSKLLWPWSVDGGSELWDSDCGRMVVMNHESMIDPVVIVISDWAHGRTMRPIFKSDLEKHEVLTALLARLGAIPIQRGKADLKAVRRAQRALQRGEDVLVFPEGTRIHSDEQEVTLHAGFALMAQLAKAPVLPVAIVGARDGAPGGNPPLRPTRIFLRVGKMIRFDELGVKGRKKVAAAMEERAMDAVYALRDALRAEHPGKM